MSRSETRTSALDGRLSGSHGGTQAPPGIPSVDPHYDRRAFAGLLVTGGIGYFLWNRRAEKRVTDLPDRVTIADFDNSGRLLRVGEVASMRRSDEEWRRQLPSDSYSVTRKQDTEFAGTGEYDKFYADGIYRCICCRTALFASGSKYASGTGWPSFTQPIAEENVRVVETTSMFGIREMEVRCTRCAAHLGHVFDDGPPPANLRYCINSVALRFNKTTS